MSKEIVAAEYISLDGVIEAPVGMENSGRGTGQALSARGRHRPSPPHRRINRGRWHADANDVWIIAFPIPWSANEEDKAVDVTSINWWALGGAVAAGYVVGGLWYSPMLFIRPWARMSGVDGAKFNAGMPKALVMDGISFAVMALVLDQVLRAWGATTLAEGVLVTFIVWLGFIATSLLHSVTYEHRPLAFYAINAGYRLVSIAIIGVILTLWK